MPRRYRRRLVGEPGGAGIPGHRTVALRLLRLDAAEGGDTCRSGRRVRAATRPSGRRSCCRDRVLGRERVGPRVRAASSRARDRADPGLLPVGPRAHHPSGVPTALPPRLQRRPALLDLQEGHAGRVLADDGEAEGVSALVPGSGGDGRLSLPPQTQARRRRLRRVRLKPRRGPVPPQGGRRADPHHQRQGRHVVRAVPVRRQGGRAHPRRQAPQHRKRWPLVPWSRRGGPASDRYARPRADLRSFTTAQAPTVVFAGQSMNAMPTTKATLTARMNRYQGLKYSSSRAVDTLSPTTTIGRHHPPWANSTMPATMRIVAAENARTRASGRWSPSSQECDASNAAFSGSYFGAQIATWTSPWAMKNTPKSTRSSMPLTSYRSPPTSERMPAPVARSQAPPDSTVGKATRISVSEAPERLARSGDFVGLILAAR